MHQYQVHKTLLFLSTQISFAININGANDLRMIKPDFQDATVSLLVILKSLKSLCKDSTGYDLLGFGSLSSVASDRKLRKYQWRKKRFH